MSNDYLKRQFLLLQVNDALFPIGGYSHSYGLETYIQKEIVHDVRTAEEYIRSKLKYGLLYSDLLAVRLAFDYTLAGELTELDELEEVMEASRIPLELREASKKLGSRFVKTLGHMDIPWESDIFSRYLLLRKGKTTSHSCAYGAFCACIGVERRQMLFHFLYAQTSAMITNCVKSIPLSQSEGQRLLASLSPFISELIIDVEKTGEEMLCASNPAFDLRSISHQYLYSRLYMS